MFKLFLLGFVLIVIGLGISFLFFGFLFETIGNIVIKTINKTKENIFGEGDKNEK
jgi:Na+-transporting methylmalonyl-CoA/oxaloacetate decarboxylase gamma subunit